ncbi:MAG: TonB-dependent receptor [Dysgonamonadaceae bacterium]
MNATKKGFRIFLAGFFFFFASNQLVFSVPEAMMSPSQVKQSLLKISGKVVDKNGEPLIGVSISAPETGSGTMTDENGNYSIAVPNVHSKLQFTYVGYKTVSVEASSSIVNVKLESGESAIDEVIVVGYGTMKKSDVTGAISSIKPDALIRQPVSNVTSALQGVVPGVTVTSNSGAPGGSVNVRIRGIGTVNNSDPLYVVDGQPMDNINFLSAADIQSMEILKDASATAIYGARGANGVVLITTKQGKPGKTVVTLDAYWGGSQILNNLNLLSGPEWYDIEVAKGLDVTKFTDTYKLNKNTSTNWLKEISREASIQNYSLGISGGMKDEYKYNTSINYISQQGTIRKTDYKRFSVRQNIEKTVVKDIFTIGTNASISNSKENRILEGSNTVGIVNSAIKLEPVVPVKDVDGNYGWSPYQDYNNPVADIDYTSNYRKIFSVVGNMYADLNFGKGFKFKSSFGADIRKTDTYLFIPVFYVSNYQQNTESEVSRGYTRSDYYVWENTLSFNRTFKEKHTINAVVGYSNEWGRTETLNGTKYNTPNDSEELQYLSAAQTGDNATGTAYESALISYLGRVNYNYDNRYLATLSIRHDGSSRFGSTHRYGTFPSFALGWTLSNESFFKKVDSKFVSSLKVRAGWGRIGNQNIGNYKYQNLLTNYIQYAYLYGTKETLYQGITAVALANKDVKWETTESTNIGIDATFMDNRLSLTAEYYNKDTKDMLLTEPIPNYLGYESGPLTNIGSANNRGFEASMEWRDKINDFNYNIGFNISTIRNRMGDIINPLTGGSIRNGNATYTVKGKPIGSFYGYKTNGLVQTSDQLAEVQKLQPKAQLGDVVFVDVTGEGGLTSADKTFIGNPIPDFIYGINLGASFKGFDINVQMGGTYGNDIFNAMRYFTYDLASMTNKDKAVLNYWTPQNTNTNIPRLAKVDSNDNMRISDRYIEDGSYLRLRNVQIGYTLPASLTQKLYMSKVRIYLTGQNLLTFTKYSGADPEIGQIDEDNTLSRGVDIGTYPQARTITGGISITF